MSAPILRMRKPRLRWQFPGGRGWWNEFLQRRVDPRAPVPHWVSSSPGAMENPEVEFWRETYLPTASAHGPWDHFVCVKAPLSTSASYQKALGTGQSFLHQPPPSSRPPTHSLIPFSEGNDAWISWIPVPISEFWIVSARSILSKMGPGTCKHLLSPYTRWMWHAAMAIPRLWQKSPKLKKNGSNYGKKTPHNLQIYFNNQYIYWMHLLVLWLLSRVHVFIYSSPSILLSFSFFFLFQQTGAK